MSIPFSQRPGRHERHYRRRLDNPLFGGSRAAVDEVALLEAQRLDHDELLAFLGELRGAVQRAVALRPNEDSEVVLRLKEDLDRLYETSAGLAEDQGANQAAIRDLIEVIMHAVERGAAGDPRALDELDQERAARAAHFALLRHPLVADLLHPHSAVGADDLAPTLLGAAEDELTAALQLFDHAQLASLCAAAEALLADTAEAPAEAQRRLAQLHAALIAAPRPDGRLN